MRSSSIPRLRRVLHFVREAIVSKLFGLTRLVNQIWLTSNFGRCLMQLPQALGTVILMGKLEQQQIYLIKKLDRVRGVPPRAVRDCRIK